MEGKLDEFEKEITGAKTLEAYIKAYRYRIENTIDASPYGVERVTEKRMLAELEKFVPKVNLSRYEMERSYCLLTSEILVCCSKIDKMKESYAYLRRQVNAKGVLDVQKKIAESNIEKVKAEREAYKNSLKILLERME
ncbi:MAG: hypothetical protein KAR08_01255 [Candidatus Heimdallarchaeota archaeon]|nr:hypothetical protein [Candidatus Heimdallarchaeota archaeon]